jgi:hypothetical protein
MASSLIVGLRRNTHDLKCSHEHGRHVSTRYVPFSVTPDDEDEDEKLPDRLRSDASSSAAPTCVSAGAGSGAAVAEASSSPRFSPSSPPSPSVEKHRSRSHHLRALHPTFSLHPKHTPIEQPGAELEAEARGLGRRRREVVR